jgi:hypothetical protein
MANLLIVGNTLVHPAEYKEKKQQGNIGKLISSMDSGQLETIQFQSGSVSNADIRAVFAKMGGAEADNKSPNPSTPIGLGMPLTVQILSIYTGQYPTGIFGGRKDLMLTSSVKSSVTFDAAARAINKIDKKADARTYLEFIASESGTRIVYYTPAVDALNTDVSFELIADTFEQEVFDQVAGLLQSAASVPLFMPAAGYLLGAAGVVKMAGTLGNTLLAQRPYLRDNYSVKFNNAGDFDSIARNLLICNNADVSEFAGCEVQRIDTIKGGVFRVVDKQSQEPYNGDAPYLIVNLDGQERKDLAAFSPKQASSALLQKFYGADDKQTVVTQTIEDAMQLYNDMNYLTKADKMKSELDKLKGKESTDEYKKNEALYKAYINNIQNDEFKKRIGL